MKAITLWEPWASLMAAGEKHVETRIWKTAYRGPSAIHAAKKSPPEWLGASRHRDEFQKQLAIVERRHGWQNGWWKNTAGRVVCIVNLIAVIPTSDLRDELSKQELLFGNYEDGRYAWVTGLVEVFKPPIKARGNRLLWNWDGRP